MASRYGKTFTFALKCKIMGMQTREFSECIIKDLDLPLTVDEFVAETRALLEVLFPKCKPLPGKSVVETLLSYL